MRTLKFMVNPGILSPRKLQQLIEELQDVGEYNLQTGEFIYDDTSPDVINRLRQILDANLLNVNNE